MFCSDLISSHLYTVHCTLYCPGLVMFLKGLRTAENLANAQEHASNDRFVTTPPLATTPHHPVFTRKLGLWELQGAVAITK